MLLNEAIFRATHHSYAGREKGSVLDQLRGGCRCLELDLHGSADSAELFVGDLAPGEGVSLGDGNPERPAFISWLDVVTSWCSHSPASALVTLVLDLKESVLPHHVSSLDVLLHERIGSALYAPDSRSESWPDVERVRGRILVLVTGCELARVDYIQRGGRSAFVETQQDDDLLPVQSALGAPVEDLEWLGSGRLTGKLTRGWGYERRSPVGIEGALPTWPATDTPNAAWYQALCRAAGALA